MLQVIHLILNISCLDFENRVVKWAVSEQAWSMTTAEMGRAGPFKNLDEPLQILVSQKAEQQITQMINQKIPIDSENWSFSKQIQLFRI